MQWAGHVCCAQPAGAGAGPKARHSGGHQVTTMLSPLCSAVEAKLGHVGLWGRTMGLWTLVRVEYVPPKLCWGPNSEPQKVTLLGNTGGADAISQVGWAPNPIRLVSSEEEDTEKSTTSRGGREGRDTAGRGAPGAADAGGGQGRVLPERIPRELDPSPAC